MYLFKSINMEDIDVTAVDTNAFDEAIRTRQFDTAKKLLPKVDINSKDSNGNTYVIRACINNDVDTFKWLMQNGAKTDVLDASGKNVLFLAIVTKRLDIIRWLADQKLLLETTYYGQTPLHAAVLMDQFDIVKVLVGAGQEVDVQNEYGKTALDLANQQINKNILKWLLANRSFEILDGALYEAGKIARLESYFDRYGYEYLNAKSLERNATIAEYAASTKQIGILKWLQSKKIPVDEALLIESNSQPKQTYNLLLVGETDVGKSTFINAFMNYLEFNTMEEAEAAKTVRSLIPSNFIVTDENFVPQVVKFGSDVNESITSDASSTQPTRSYAFETEDVRICLIDTPSIGKTHEIEKTKENFAKVLTAIGKMKDLHLICILLKPNEHISVPFKYCIKQLLSTLHEGSNKNVIFLFTYSRTNFYRPGDTVIPLKTILDEIKSKSPFIDIPFGGQNVFCVDNEAIRYLIAKRNNIQFDDDEKANFIKSWGISAKASIGMFEYVRSVRPVKTQEAALDEARQLIVNLSTPLAEVAALIQNNIERIDRIKTNLYTSQTVDGSQKFLKIPRIGLKVFALPYPMTVCTNPKCTETVKIEDITKVNYKQICHAPCYLKNSNVSIGDIELGKCWAMISKAGAMICRHSSCLHSFKEHMHIYYKTEPYDYTEEDEDIPVKQSKVETKDIQRKIKELDVRQETYEGEVEIIHITMAKFAYFWMSNTTTAYNDIYKKYIEYLIKREKDADDNEKRIENYQDLIAYYESYKKLLAFIDEITQSTPNPKPTVSASDVIALAEALYKLPTVGKTIRDLFMAQKNAAAAESPPNTE